MVIASIKEIATEALPLINRITDLFTISISICQLPRLAKFYVSD